MVDTGILFSNMKSPSHECIMTFWSLTNIDFPTDQTFHQWHELDTKLDLHWILNDFHGSFATGVSCQQGTLTPQDTWSRPLMGGLYIFPLLRQAFPILHRFNDRIELDPHRIKSICDECGMPTGSAYPAGHLVPPPFWDMLVFQLLRPNCWNLPCLYSTFHLEYPLVLPRFCFVCILKCVPLYYIWP